MFVLESGLDCEFQLRFGIDSGFSSKVWGRVWVTFRIRLKVKPRYYVRLRPRVGVGLQGKLYTEGQTELHLGIGQDSG